MDALSVSERRLPKDDIFAGVGGSILVHGLIFALAFVVPWAMPRKSVHVPFYNVNLVSMKDMGLGPPSSKKGMAGKDQDGPKVQNAPKASSSRGAKSAPLVAVKRLRFDEPVTKTETELKKMDISEAPRVRESAQSAVAVEKSLDNLIHKPKPTPQPNFGSQTPKEEAGGAKNAQPNVGHEPAGDKTQTVAAGSSGKTAGSATGAKAGAQEGGGGSPDGGQVGLARRLYYTEVWNAIRRQWAMPEFLKSQKLEAVLVVVVRRDGKILDLQFERKSGQPVFDESVERAVRKAEPLPPFPEIYSPPKEEIGLRFRPEDIT
ncbi:MAG: TonB family protein [Deltaproteobacteria bacterium]|nr:MAG: TonB family protein [Deltaproteobacteria bacterium]